MGIDAESHVDLWSFEVFGKMDQDWSWDLCEDVALDLDIAAALGVLDGEGETAIYGHVGPVAELTFGDFPIILVLSTGPSLYSEDDFDGFDIGSNLQFTSSIGLKLNIDAGWSVEYRFQHTSNAGFGDPNPGLNMHVIGLGYSY